MIKIMTLNVNGIRAAINKGLLIWLKELNADIICLQEIRAHEIDVPKEIRFWENYYVYFNSAFKKGYSGVAILTKVKPKNISYKIGNDEMDIEGRYIQIEYDNFKVVSLYLPSGSSGVEKQEKKFRCMDYYFDNLNTIIMNNDNVIVCGDWNIAHNEIDLKNWKANMNNSGFLKEERDWFSSMLNLGFKDVFRYLYPEKIEYTWWSNRGRAYEKNIGWRIDYQISTSNLVIKAKEAVVYRERKFSDHAPLIISYDLLPSCGD